MSVSHIFDFILRILQDHRYNNYIYLWHICAFVPTQILMICMNIGCALTEGIEARYCVDRMVIKPVKVC